MVVRGGIYQETVQEVKARAFGKSSRGLCGPRLTKSKESMETRNMAHSTSVRIKEVDKASNTF